MELLLRHAINYLNMKKSKAVSAGGVIDNEDAFIGVQPMNRCSSFVMMQFGHQQSCMQHPGICVLVDTSEETQLIVVRLLSQRTLTRSHSTSPALCCAFTCSATSWMDRSASPRWPWCVDTMQHHCV